ncbi:CRISPR-associated endonuclease Cas1 [Thermoflavimicrobium daqui]|jgi:CRISPR-associated protein Cas1|uniref:CRISPR-associated endonuclease Cas1 n=1 Tax=Thermoflavimicrobium daqui TaxID=2137476 RepID=A0A364K772_9BACL|nr:CRISPR-associated endonuclease Cas1 [Thermoflavimicrobium daqui]RAL26159.1 CRISPR-associated endonuclease Cas1 [Thermoflavimicrobium daqui]
MGTFYLTEPYCFVRKESERLKIFKDRKLVKEVKVNEYIRFFIHESSTLTTDALLLLAEKEKEVIYFSGNQFAARLVGKENKNVRLRIAQVEAHLSDQKSLEIARYFVLAKLKNTRVSLQRFARRKKIDLDSTILFLKQVMEKSLLAENLDQLRGLEGVAAKEYFRVFPGLLSRKEFSFLGRSKRPAKDPVNALLNYGYVLLKAEITSALFSAGLDPYIGFLHRERYGRESLALDMMEEFRAILVDNLVIKMINQGIIKQKDFDQNYEEPRLTDQGRRRFLLEFDQRRKDEVFHELLKQKLSYREIIQKQALLLAKYLKNEMDDYYPFLTK